MSAGLAGVTYVRWWIRARLAVLASRGVSRAGTWPWAITMASSRFSRVPSSSRTPCGPPVIPWVSAIATAREVCTSTVTWPGAPRTTRWKLSCR